MLDTTSTPPLTSHPLSSFFPVYLIQLLAGASAEHDSPHSLDLDKSINNTKGRLKLLYNSFGSSVPLMELIIGGEREVESLSGSNGHIFFHLASFQNGLMYNTHKHTHT